MKKLLLLMMLAGFAQTVFGQKQLAIYSHDDAGNRNHRHFDPNLPVTLVEFLATKQENFVALNWKTSSEINSSHFELQRSSDGRNWRDIGIIRASGESSSEQIYTFYDRAPLVGDNLYRLKMIDHDGTFAYSRLRSVAFQTQIAIFPNPVRDRLIISSGKLESVQLLNVSGQTVLKTTNFPVNGIDISKLATGIYLIRVLLSDGTELNSKVIKE